MLVNLHVKNFAIIDEADVDFGEHLNILTGETGAGKSILIGSLNIALGGRVSPEMIGRRDDTATVEAVFSVRDEATKRLIRELDIPFEDDEVVISRKITESRSVNKINGESVPAGVIRQVASLCIDIHGQNEHQSLLKPSKQRDIVDRFGGDELSKALQEVSDVFQEYESVRKEIEENDLTDEELAREIDFLNHQKNEIESANLTKEEIATIDEEYRIASNSGTVVDVLSSVYNDGTKPASDMIGRVIPEIRRAATLNPKVSEYTEQLIEVENLLTEMNRDLSGFMQDYSFDEERLRELEKRLDLIHGLQSKYGETYDEIMSHYDIVEERLGHYADFEKFRKERKEQFDRLVIELADKSRALTSLRKKAAEKLKTEIEKALEDLNFAHVEFEIEMGRSEHFSEHGVDDIEFLIATNPGEPVRSLAKVASGGELSRIMLAIKSVFANSDEIETLIFDEIDSGISGRTAQMVSEKMNVIAKHHQVICITHLAQIASMADTHFVIEKEVGADASQTSIRKLDSDESVEELARLLGGAEITDAVMENAREMKEMAQGLKRENA